MKTRSQRQRLAQRLRASGLSEAKIQKQLAKKANASRPRNPSQAKKEQDNASTEVQ